MKRRSPAGRPFKRKPPTRLPSTFRTLRLQFEPLEVRALLSAVPDLQNPPYFSNSSQVSVARTAGETGSFNAQLFFPATSTGTFDPSGGPYPVVTFAHDYMTSATTEYTQTMSTLASFGYIVIAPRSYESALDLLNTVKLGHDESSAYNYLVAQNSSGASPFFGHVDTSHGFTAMGHGMGGAASLSQATLDPHVHSVIAWAARNMTGFNLSTVMPNVHVPVQMLAGTQDGVVSSGNTSTYYSNANAPVVLKNLVGGFHYGFEDNGSGILADSGSMPRATELAYARAFSVEWLDTYMKGRSSYWQQIWGPDASADPQVQYSRKSGVAMTSYDGQIQQSANGGNVLIYPVNVQNTGTSPTSFSLFADNNVWSTQVFPEQTPVLAVGETTTVVAFVTLPDSMPKNVADTLVFSARSDTDGGTRGYLQLQSTSANNAPEADLNGDAAGIKYTSVWSKAGPINLASSGALVTDLDNDNIVSMSLTLTNAEAGDVLAANTAGTNISQTFNGVALVLSGSDTAAHYQQVLRSITYDQTLGDPAPGAKIIEVVVNDGTVDSAAAEATITINHAPQVDLSTPGDTPDYLSVWHNTGPVVIVDASNAGIVDDDGDNMASLVVTLTSPHAGDVLTADTDGTAIVQNYSGGTLTLSGADTLANYQQVLRTVTYDNTTGDPGTNSVTATVVVNDGNVDGNTAVATIITTLDHPPFVDLNGSDAGQDFLQVWTQTGAVNVVDPANATLADPDGGNLVSLTATLSVLSTGDVLAVDTSGTSIVQAFVNGTLSLTGSDTLAHYQQVLRTLTYDNTAAGTPDGSPLTISIVASDGGLDSNTAVSTVTIAPDHPPMVDLNGGQSGTNIVRSWTNDGPVFVTDLANATLTDSDGGDLASLSATILAVHPGDVLTADTSFTNITQSYANGTLTLSGSDTIQHYEQVLRTLSYDNILGGPGTSSVLVTVLASDGSLNSNLATSIILVIGPPTLDLNGSDQGSTFGQLWGNTGPVNATDSQATLTDFNIANMAAIGVFIADFHAGDVLSADTTGTSISSDYVDGTLVLSGTDTIAHYQQVLRTIRYDNTTGDPGAPFITLSFVANDGHATSSVATSYIVVDYAPTVDLNGPGPGINFGQTWSNTGPVSIVDPSATAGDPDTSELASLTVTIPSYHAGDVLTADTTDTDIALDYAAGTLVLSGSDSLANYEKVLRTIRYDNLSGDPGVGTVSVNFVASDGGMASTVATTSIHVAINHRPIVDLNGAAAGTSYAHDWYYTAAVPIVDVTAASIDDLDGDDLTSMTVALNVPQTGDLLAAQTAGTNISQNFADGTLTLSGTDTVAHYQQVLRTLTYHNTAGGPGTSPLTISIVVSDGVLNSNPVTATITVVPDIPPTLDLNGAAAGTGWTQNWSNAGSVTIVDPANATVGDANGGLLTSLVVTISTPHTGDFLNANTTGTSISLAHTTGGLILSGSDTISHYQQVLRTITYNNTAGGPGTNQFMATIVASDGVLDSNMTLVTINVPPAIRLNGPISANYSTNWYDNGGDSYNGIANLGTSDTGTTLPPITPAVPNPTSLSNFAFWMPTFGPGYQEQDDVPGGRTGEGGFTPLALGQPVGQVIAPAAANGSFIGGWSASSLSATDRATFMADPYTGEGAFYFGGGPHGVSSVVFNNASRAFDTIHQGGAFTFYAQVNADELLQGGTIVSDTDNQGFNPTHAGINVWLDALGHIELTISDGTQNLVNAASAETIIPGITYNVIISAAGLGTDGLVGKQGAIYVGAVGGVTTVTPFISANVVPDTTHHAYADLSFGVSQMPTSDSNADPFHGYIANPAIQFSVATASERSWYQSYHPLPAPGIGAGGTLLTTTASVVNNQINPDAISDQFLKIDPGLTNTLFQDTDDPAEFTTPVGGGADLVGTVQNSTAQNSLPGILGRDVRYMPSSIAPPTLVSNPNTGRTELAFFGQQNAWNGLIISQGETWEPEYITGDFTLLLVGQSNVVGDPTDRGQQGSEFIGGPGSGIVLWGPGSKRPNQVDAYFGSGNTPVHITATITDPFGYHVFGIRKTADHAYLYVDGVLAGSIALTSPVYMGTNYLGWDNNPSTVSPAITTRSNLNGRISSLRIYTADIGDALTIASSNFLLNQLVSKRAVSANGAVALANVAQATLTDAGGLTSISSLTVTLANYGVGDMLTVPILPGVSLTAAYAAGRLTLSGNDTLAHYQQELRLIGYNNINHGSGATQKKVVFTASDGTTTSNPVTATININVGTGQVLGNRLFYNNSRYDGHTPTGTVTGDAAINSYDDAAVAPDKIGFSGTGTATFANISSFSKGITGIMVDVVGGIGNHSLINKLSGDISFLVAPTVFVPGGYNNLSTWLPAPAPTNISVRLGAGVGGSDRIEITWASTIAVKNNWLAINVHAGGNTGLDADDLFFFGSSVGNSGLGDPAGQSKTEATDSNVSQVNTLGLTVPIFQILDYDDDGSVNASDGIIASSNNGNFIRYLVNVTGGGFAPSGAPSAIPAGGPAGIAAAVTGSDESDDDASDMTSALVSGLNRSPGTSSASAAPPATFASVSYVASATASAASSAPNPDIPSATDQALAQLHPQDDELDALLGELGLG